MRAWSPPTKNTPPAPRTAAGQLDRQRHQEGARAVGIEPGHDRLAHQRRVGRGRRQHGDARALAAGQLHDALPDLGIVGPQVAADDDQRSLGPGRRHRQRRIDGRRGQRAAQRHRQRQRRLQQVLQQGGGHAHGGSGKKMGRRLPSH
jgi:hypothetical protein